MKPSLKSKILFLLTSIFLVASCSENKNTTTTKEEPSVKPTEKIDITLSKADGYSVKFNNSKASYYIIKDNNDYRKQIKIQGNTTSEYFYYTPEVVGKHEIYVQGYSKGGSLLTESNKVDSVEVEPVYAYSPFSAHYYVSKNQLNLLGIPSSLFDEADRLYGKADSHYFFLDNNLNWTFKGALNAKNGQKLDEIDFSSSPEMLDKIMSNLKGLGNNVLMLHTAYSFLEKTPGQTWWYKDDLDNCLLRYMNAAWKYGMKCLITDSVIMSTCQRGTEEFNGDKTALKNEVQSAVRSRLLHSEFYDSDLRVFLQHKAFYGFIMPDEPYHNSATMYAIGYASEVINEIYETDTFLKQFNKPIAFTCLLPYATWLFASEDVYVSYLKQWLECTKTNYINFDMYNYTTMSYGKGLQGNYCNVKRCLNGHQKIREEFPNVKITQTINCGNSYDCDNQTVQDIYSCHLMTAAMKFYGYGLFVFSPFDIAGTWNNTAVTYKQEKNTSYDHLKNAYNQVTFLKGLLYEYEVDSILINQNPSSGYGYGVKQLVAEYKNGGKTAKMYLNYETDMKKATDVSFDVALQEGQKYYLFGNGATMVEKTASSSTTIKLNKAEGVLIF